MLLVTKDVELRRRLAQLLAGQTQFKDVGAGMPGASTLPKGAHPDIAILSVGEGKAPQEQIQAVRELFPQTAVLLISRKALPANVEYALRAGAMGWVLETDTSSEWLEALRAIQGGQLYVSEAISPGLLQRVLKSKPTSSAGVDSLTDRELVVFELLGTGLSTVDIARRLQLSAKTVESHREKIKHRLGLGDAAALLHFAYAWSQRRGLLEPQSSSNPAQLP